MVKVLPVVPSAVSGSLTESPVAPSWREYRPYIVEPGKVNPLISLFCPEGAVSLENETVSINLKFCKGCGICAVESEGIVMVPEYTGAKGVLK